MAVIDSSVLIPLSRIGKLNLLRIFFKSILITKEVYNEVKEGIGSSEIEEGLKSWIHIDKRDFKNAQDLSEREGVELADASIILLSKETKDLLVSNDYHLITIARARGIECLWLTGFLIQCVTRKIITKKETKDILLALIKVGMRLDNEVYATILDEINKMN